MDRPLCKCHGEPMYRNSFLPSGKQKWCCKRKRDATGKRHHENGGREKRLARYRDRVERGVCVKCEGPLTSSVLCWDCLNEQEARYALRL